MRNTRARRVIRSHDAIGNPSSKTSEMNNGRINVANRSRESRRRLRMTAADSQEQPRNLRAVRAHVSTRREKRKFMTAIGAAIHPNAIARSDETASRSSRDQREAFSLSLSLCSSSYVGLWRCQYPGSLVLSQILRYPALSGIIRVPGYCADYPDIPAPR